MTTSRERLDKLLNTQGDDRGTEFSTDPDELRRLAFSILGAPA